MGTDQSAPSRGGERGNPGDYPGLWGRIFLLYMSEGLEPGLRKEGS